jgi:AraC-like DNA-binding protein
MTDSNEPFAASHLPRVKCLRDEYESVLALPNPHVIVMRTTDLLRGKQEKEIKNPDSYYRAAVCLRRVEAELSSNGRTFFCGLAQPGMFHVTEPTSRLRGRFSLPSDGVHLLFSARYVDELCRESASRVLRTDKVQYDAELIRLCSALTYDTALKSTADNDELYLSGLTVAILGRLLHSSAQTDSGGSFGRHALAKWRMRRVQQYVEEHLSGPISLVELASVSGLSRMHFAVQFRRATGLRPHEFVLRERIKRAKRLLCSTDLPLIQIALDVGFQTHSHFSATFKRLAGMSPICWRALHE